MRGRDLAHADSPASPLLSGSLNTTRDGITGYWDGTMTVPHDVQDLRLPTNEGYLDKLGMPAQAAILEAQLVTLVSARGTPGEARLYYKSRAVTAIARPSPEYFAADLDWVRAYSDLRADRLGEIHMQLDDLLSYFGGLCYLDEGRRKYSLMMLDVARRLAIHVERIMKYYCRAPRPIDFAQQVQPMIQTPDHSSFPSGHATEAFAIATVFHRLSTGQGPRDGIRDHALPFKLAHRIASNRTVAGVHFPVDSFAGAWVGCYIGELFHLIATGGTLDCGDMPDAAFELDEEGEILHDAQGLPRTPDFLLSRLGTLADDQSIAVTRLPVARALWARAAAEWPPVRAAEE